MKTLRDHVLALYTRLEALAEEHVELTDTDAREALHLALNYYFVWAETSDELPCNYCMFSEQADTEVAEAVEEFLEDALPLAEAEDVPLGQARLDLLQDDSLRTPEGASFDLFIGQVEEPLEPEPLDQVRFEPGDYSQDEYEALGFGADDEEDELELDDEEDEE